MAAKRRAGRGGVTGEKNTGNPGGKPWTPENRPKPVIYTKLQTKQHIDFIEALIIGGYTTKHVVGMTREKFGCSRARIVRLAAEIRERWMDEEREQRAVYKAGQVRRVLGHMRAAMNDGEEIKVTDEEGNVRVIGRRRDHTAVVQYERLLAQMTGTLAPLSIDASASFRDALDELDDRKLAQIEARYDREMQLAEAAKKLLPPGTLEAIEAELVTDDVA